MNGSRYEFALQILRGLNLPLDADDATVRKAAHDAYPWGERKHHPYTVWRQAVKDWQAERRKLQAWQGGAR